MGGESADSLYVYGLFCFAFSNSEMLVVNIVVDFIPLERKMHCTQPIFYFYFLIVQLKIHCLVCVVNPSRPRREHSKN